MASTSGTGGGTDSLIQMELLNDRNKTGRRILVYPIIAPICTISYIFTKNRKPSHKEQPCILLTESALVSPNPSATLRVNSVRNLVLRPDRTGFLLDSVAVGKVALGL